jgi:hypothetical protein
MGMTALQSLARFIYAPGGGCPFYCLVFFGGSVVECLLLSSRTFAVGDLFHHPIVSLGIVIHHEQICRSLLRLVYERGLELLLLLFVLHLDLGTPGVILRLHLTAPMPVERVLAWWQC